MALTGRLDGDFVDEFEPPVADDLPSRGFDARRVGLRRAGRRSGERSTVAVAPGSERLELLDAVPGVGRQRPHAACACC